MRPPLLVAALSVLLLASCFAPGDGQAPPLDRLYFPTGLALDDTVTVPTDPMAPPPAAPYLYIASSDFDLQFRASALASYDLGKLYPLLPVNCNADADCANGRVCDTESLSTNPSFFCVDPPAVEGGQVKPCGALAEHSAADQLLYPGRCAAIDPHGESGVIRDAVGIGAFATDVIFRAETTDQSGHALSSGKTRLFLPVRGDATLHWIDVTDGRFDCGQANTSDHSCDGTHRVGDSVDENYNGLRQPPEPFAIAASDRAEPITVDTPAGSSVGAFHANNTFITVTNQTSGSVSLFVNYWDRPAPALVLQSVLTGLPSAPVGIAAVPRPDPSLLSSEQYEPGFLVVYKNAPQVDLLRVLLDNGQPSGSPVQPVEPEQRLVLSYAGGVPINANSIGSDSRGIVIDDSERQADYAACRGLMDPALTTCLRAVNQPRVFVSSRAPASLLVGALTANVNYASGTSDLPAFTDSVPLTVGPSRVVLGKVKVPSRAADAIPDPAGSYVLEPRVFIVCFDSRRIFLYDPKRRTIETSVSTGRGPFALAIDSARGLGYVAHFTDSYLGVISLDQRFPRNYAAIIASVGIPSPPRASK